MTKQELLKLREYALQQRNLNEMEVSYNYIIEQELKNGLNIFWTTLLNNLSMQTGIPEIETLEESATFEQISSDNYNFRKKMFQKFFAIIRAKKISEKNSNHFLNYPGLVTANDICQFSIFSKDGKSFDGYFRMSELLKKIELEGYKENAVIEEALEESKNRPELKRLTISVSVSPILTKKVS